MKNVKGFIGVFENGNLLFKLSQVVEAPVELFEMICCLYEQALKETLGNNHYVAWEYDKAVTHE